MNVQTYTLANGMKLWVHVNKDEPRIYTQITVNAGSKNDPIQKSGLAHYLEHLMFKGTSKIGALDWEKESVLLNKIENLYEDYNKTDNLEEKAAIYKSIDAISLEASKLYAAGDFDRLMQNIGAKSVNAGTSYDYTTFIADIPKNELEKWMTIESERFNELVLRGFHTELETVYEEFNISQDNDSRKVFNQIMKGLFGNHPYGHHAIIGFGEDLKKPSQVQIHEFYNEYYIPENIILMLSGDIDLEEIQTIANQTFGNLTKKSKSTQQDLKFKLNHYVSKEYNVFGNEMPFMMMAWPVEYKSQFDYDKLLLLKGLLQNGKSGLIDKNLLNTQMVLEAQSFTYLFKEGGAFGIYGKGIENQSLSEVKEQFLKQIELLKKGEFEDWLLEAIINNFILNDTKFLETNKGRVQLMNFVFTHQLSWDFIENRVERLKKITKKDIVEFANDILKIDPVVVNKLQGVDENVMKVEKPPITPIHLNNNMTDFGNNINQMPVKASSPVFTNFKEKIKFYALKESLNLAYVNNNTEGLFELHWIINEGMNEEPLLGAFYQYVENCGTKQMSLQDIKNELFRYGLQIDFSIGNEKTYISLTGLELNVNIGISLVYNWLLNLVADDDLWIKIVKQIKIQRANDKSEKNEILRKGLVNFAKYGFESPYLNQPNTDSLLEMKVGDLIQQFKNIIFKTNEIYYLGNLNPDSIVSELKKFHIFTIQNNSKVNYDEKVTTSNNIYFVDFPGVQVDSLMFSVKQNKLENKDKIIADVFNQYFGVGLSSVVFQEIRESKAIAYSTYAQYGYANLPNKKDYFQAFLGTQPDKLNLAIKTMLDLINHYDLNSNELNKTLDNIWKKIENHRIPSNKIYWQYTHFKEQGLDNDINELFWKLKTAYSIESVLDFRNKNIMNMPNNILLIGDKKNIDFEFLKQIGEIQELSIEKIMPY